MAHAYGPPIDAEGDLALVCTPEDAGSDAVWYSQAPDPTAAALAELWRANKLCDVVLVASDGAELPAHRLMLAAAAGFFRALFTGAGTAMREAQTSCDGSAGPSAVAADSQLQRVKLQYGAPELETLLEAVYARRIRVAPDSVGALMDMAGFLEAPLLTAACCSYLRAALAPPSCVDVLLMAHQYHCAGLRRDALSFLCARLPSLLQSEWRGSLARLPRDLLVELLASDELVVESELDVLGAVAEWVAADTTRAPHLPDLLGLVQLAALPPEPAAGPCLAALSTSPEGRTVMDAVARLIQQRDQVAAGVDWHTDKKLPPQQQQQQKFQQDGGYSQQQQQVWGTAGLSAAEAAGQAAAQRAAAANAAVSGAAAHGAAPVGATVAAVLLERVAHSSDGGVPSGDLPFLMADCPLPPAAACSSGSGSGGGGSGPVSAGGPSGVGVRRMGMHLEGGRWPAARRRAYRPSKLLVAGGHDPSWRSLRGVELLDPLDPSPEWAPGPALLPGDAMPFAASALLGRDLYIVGGAMFSSVVRVYSCEGSSGSGMWAVCPPLGTPRVHAGVAAAAGRLFVCGGRSQVNQVLPTVESFSPGSSQWDSTPDPMRDARYACAAASLGGSIYVVGGQSSRSAIFDTLEALDPDTGRWLPISARMSTGRKYAGAAPLNGRLYVCGGLRSAERQRLATVEAFDPREGVFREIAPMMSARSSCGAAALGDRLYVAGGSADGAAFHDTMEVFEPAMGRWRPGPALGAARSGLALAAI